MKLATADIPFQLGETLQSEIPDLKELSARIGKGEAIADTRLRASTANTFLRSGRQLLGNVAAQQGFALDVPDEMQKLRNAVMEPVRDILDLEAIADVAARFVADISEDALAAGMSVVEAIPIIKAVVKIIFTYSGLVKKALRTARQYGKPTVKLVTPTSFSREADQDVFNYIVLRAVHKTRDWTGVFSPPGLGLRSGARSDNFSIDTTRARGFSGMEHGIRILATDAVQEPTWLGSVPGSGASGTPWLHEGWQFDAFGLQDTGIFYPTARNAAPSVWQMASNPRTPAMFCVDTRTVIQRWQAYLNNAWEWTRDTKNRYITPPVRQQIQRWLASRFGLKEIATEYGIPKAPVVTAAAQLLRAQSAALEDAISCAYVDESYASIAGNDWHRSLWTKGRAKLLGTPALLSQVELDMVPDQEFRSEVARRGGGGRRIDVIVDSEATFGSIVPPQGGGGAAAVLALGALGGLGFLLWRLRK